MTSRSSVAETIVSHMFSDPKHDKYLKFYQPNDMYYGCGIENETYFMFENFINVTGYTIKHNRNQERYSVDYYKNYKEDELDKFYEHINDTSIYQIPLLINAHTFDKCDINCEHATLYTKLPIKPNPSFTGTTIFKLMMQNPILESMYKNEFTFDGDTIEIMTLNFYKNTVNDCITELKTSKQRVLDELNNILRNPITEDNVFKNIGKLLYQNHNYGFAKFITNMNNVTTCNNGTYHINIVLPTELNAYKEIKNISDFTVMHQNAIIAIQWLEPLFVACYGSPDIYSIHNDKFAKGSQRCAISRYISVGTYDSYCMKSGKLLDNYDYEIDEHVWYNKYHQNSGYRIPDKIGYDINFNKFTNHGIEIRFFDYFPEEYLPDVMNAIVLLCCFSLDKLKLDNPIFHVAWQSTIESAIRHGSDFALDTDYIQCLEDVFNIPLSQNTPLDVFQELINGLFDKYHNSDFAKKISPDMPRPVITNYNAIVMEINKLLINY